MTKSHKTGEIIRRINNAQKAVCIVEDFYNNCLGLVIVAMVTLFLIAIISLKFGNMIVPSVCGLLFVFLGHIWITKGWCHSVRKFLISIVLTNFYVILLIGIGLANSSIMANFSKRIIALMAVGIYFVLWILLSLLAKSEVAKIANEIVSVLFTIVFTAGTYIMSIEFNDITPYKVLQNTYQSEQQLEYALSQHPQLLSEIMKSTGCYYLEQVFLFSLPFLCVSLFCTLEVDLKDYWLKKNNQEDFWTRMERIEAEQKAGDDTEKEITE